MSEEDYIEIGKYEEACGERDFAREELSEQERTTAHLSECIDRLAAIAIRETTETIVISWAEITERSVKAINLLRDERDAAIADRGRGDGEIIEMQRERDYFRGALFNVAQCANLRLAREMARAAFAATSPTQPPSSPPPASPSAEP